MIGERAEDRAVIGVTGGDAVAFLQGLVSNDVAPLTRGPGLVWAAILTPQGKYLADFLIARLPDSETASPETATSETTTTETAGPEMIRPGTGTALMIDVKADLRDTLLRRLSMYRLRADVAFSVLAVPVTRGLGVAPPGALADPRHPALGWRQYGGASGGGAPGGDPVIDWDAIRVDHMIPETGIELIPDDTYILEAGFERLHGVDFRKGCYVGQEVTARMKHKTDLRKGLVRVRIDGDAGPGAEILADGKPAGTLFTRSGGRALAHLRLDRATGAMQAGGAQVWLDG